MKRILGLDLGPNSIGWALVGKNDDTECREGKIIASGSRIIPMDAAIQGDFDKGNSVSQTKERTQFRGTRRLRERHLLRRERLHRVLDVLGFLPEHYSAALTRYGKFKNPDGCKISWRDNSDGSHTFVFMDAYREMLSDFRRAQPDWVGEGGLVPYDWTIYYLRKKALTQPVAKQELAWILLNFNQKRGYYQLRGEDEAEDKSSKKEYMALKVVAVNDTGEQKGKATWYDIVLENGMVYHRSALSRPEWEGSVRDFIITTQLDSDGNPKTDKDGNIKRSISMPDESDWTLLKVKTESLIGNSHKTVGQYIYDALLANPKQKIRGKLVRTIERKFYRNELERILDAQTAFIPELSDPALYEACISELYPSNEAYRMSIANRGFKYLFTDDIIFYQRPLKSKKSLVADCRYEYHTYIDKSTGEQRKAPVKCIAKSNPLFQEFRLWQFVSNIRVLQRQKIVNGILRTNVDVTGEFLPTEDDRVRLFEWLNDREKVKQDVFFKDFLRIKKPAGKGSVYPYTWNYDEEKEYVCNETRGLMLKYLSKAGIDCGFLTPDVEKALWHILYSVEDKQELKRALATFASRHELDEAFVQSFAKFPPFKKEYGAYSEKAVRKLLQLMRMGSHWSADAICSETMDRINKLIDGEYDENIPDRVREKVVGLDDVSKYRALPLWLACYVVYNRHSEGADVMRWSSPDDIDAFVRNFRQHSLRNPIVEQVVLETLRTVSDIWRIYGRIDEIHIEMGRNMKQTAEQRHKDFMRNAENERTNLRIKTLLTEFVNPEYGIDGVRPYSPNQQELLRIYEDGAFSRAGDIDDDILTIKNKIGETDTKKRPTPAEIMRYKLWLDQKYQSPYTGRFIPLARLFTSDYQIEHVIPQSRYFDNSFSNKVICESAVNSLKDRMLGLEFIKQMGGQKVELGNGDMATILNVDEYEQLVTTQYKGNTAKMRKLLMDDIPDEFIARQLNDSRYISRLVKSLLSNAVREEGEVEDISKNVITCNGTITDRLKRDWGVNDVWNRIILPRFVRLNSMDASHVFTVKSAEGHDIPSMPLDFQKGFNKKRIDHRHHAMDAIVIACTTRDHVNLLNNEAAMSGNNANRYSLSCKLRRYERVDVVCNGVHKELSRACEFIKPWPTFCADVESALRSIVVSFKHNQRILTKTSNRYQHFCNGKKIMVMQKKGSMLSIRKPLHKDTVFGEINRRIVRDVKLKDAVAHPHDIVDKDLRKKIVELLASGYDVKRIKAYFEQEKATWQDVDLGKIAIYSFTKDILDRQGNVKDRYFASRESLDKSFSKETIEKSVDDSAIRKILLNHLDACGGDAETAFSPEGIEAMNRNIVSLNGGKFHQPIYKVRKYKKASRYPVGRRGNKAVKFVKSAKGTNLFYAVYETEVFDESAGVMRKNRTYLSVPLYVAIERLIAGLPVAPADEAGNEAAFVLSPNDLVYLPKQSEVDAGNVSLPLDRERIYKMVSCDGSRSTYIQYNVARPIIDEFEYSSHNKLERAVTGEMIKETCIPIKVDRLGRIVEINGKRYD